MRNEETIVAITEITCGGNIYCYNCYDIWIAEWRNRGFIESVGTYIGLVLLGNSVNNNGNVCN